MDEHAKMPRPLIDKLFDLGVMGIEVPEHYGGAGASFFHAVLVVERGFEGFSVGKKEDKLGIRASSTCELLLEECPVPRANVLGEIGKGYKVAIETLNEGRIGIGAQMVGLAQGALNHAVAYTKQRKQFGKAIADFQGGQ